MARTWDGLRFSDFESLKRWLLTTKWGAEVMRDVLASKGGARFYDEFVQRELAMLDDADLPSRPAYVVVELAHDGWVQVYGERNVRARVVQRPGATEGSVRMANLVDEWIWLSLPGPFREVYYPSAIRMTGMYERLTVQKLCKREVDLAFDLAIMKALKEVEARS